MPAYKFTASRGKTNIKDIAVAAGSAEAQTDTISVNIDATKLSQLDILDILDKIYAKIHAGKWPPL